jgi:basic amino acid/polyamine antiporter, APA family
VLRIRHPELQGKYTLPGGPYIIPTLSALSALMLMYALRIGNPDLWGFFPLVWFAFLVWLVTGLLFYFAYGRHKSMVALQATEHVAVVQPPVN